MEPSRPPPGRPRAARRRDGLLPFAAVLFATIALVVGAFWRERARATAVVAREDAALDLLHRLLAAEGRLRERQGRYGWLGELERAGLLPAGARLEPGAPPHLLAEGYRFDVLLPTGRLGPAVTIEPEGSPRGGPDEALLREHVAVVARPLSPGEDGYRVWYLDERADLYLNEGVVDVDSRLRNALPRVLLTTVSGVDPTGIMLWQREATLSRD
jgi:hypothetical protein